jgi:hypothetical protein
VTIESKILETAFHLLNEEQESTTARSQRTPGEIFQKPAWEEASWYSRNHQS